MFSVSLFIAFQSTTIGWLCSFREGSLMAFSRLSCRHKYSIARVCQLHERDVRFIAECRNRSLFLYLAAFKNRFVRTCLELSECMSVSSAEVWKQGPCLLLFPAVLSLHSLHVTGLGLAESCVACHLYSGRTEALSCSEVHGEIPACSVVSKWRLCSLPAPVLSKGIHTSVGRQYSVR